VHLQSLKDTRLSSTALKGNTSVVTI